MQSTPKGSVFGAAQHLAPAGEHDALHRWVISGPCCASLHPAPAANSAQVSDTFPLPTKPLLTASTHALQMWSAAHSVLIEHPRFWSSSSEGASEEERRRREK